MIVPRHLCDAFTHILHGCVFDASEATLKDMSAKWRPSRPGGDDLIGSRAVVSTMAFRQYGIIRKKLYDDKDLNVLFAIQKYMEQGIILMG